MTQEERNEQIALMLGWRKYKMLNNLPWQKKRMTYTNVTRPNFFTPLFYIEAFKFNSNWNLLMEAVEFIESKGYATKIAHDYCISNYGCDECVIDKRKNALTSYEDRDEPLIFELTKTKKEATFTAVSDFAKLYNEKKI